MKSSRPASGVTVTDEPSPARRAAHGAWTFLFTLVFLLVALFADDVHLGAPRWAIVVILLAPMLCSLGLLASAVGRPPIGPVLMHAGGLLFVTSMAVFCAWLLLTGRTGSGGVLSVGGIPIPLPGVVQRMLNGVVVGAAMLMFVGIAIAYGRWAWRRAFEGERPPSTQA